MKTPKHRQVFDVSGLHVMLCIVCRSAIASIGDRKPGVHHGQQPQNFRHASRPDVWTGSHHEADDSFLTSVRNRCYICHPILQACPRETRDYAVYFRTFFEIESSGDGRYSMRITIELRQLSPSIQAQVVELHGRFKILPKTGKFLPLTTLDEG